MRHTKDNKNFYKIDRTKMTTTKKVVLTIISIIILIFQLFLYYLIFVESKNISWFTAIVRIIGVIIVITLFNNSTMCSTYKLIWSSIVLFFSFAGPLLYLLFGNQRSLPKSKSKKVNNYLTLQVYKNDNLDKLKETDIKGYKYVKLLQSSLEMPVYTNVSVDFYDEIDKKHQRLLEDLKSAQKFIYIEMFIISSGKMLDSIIEILEIKAKENVEIKILYDDVGSKVTLNKSSFERMKMIPNIEIERYEPLGFSINPAVNFRDHRKIVIIDGKIGYVGGDNLADEYANWITKYGTWRDNALRIEGEAVNSLVIMFSETWYMSSRTFIDTKSHFSFDNKFQNNSFVYPYCDGPTNNSNPAYELYESLAMNAEKYLYISTPYIAIDDEFINSIINACKSGVDVRILVPGIPDKKLVYKITQSFYGDILKNGGKIYEYSKGFNHAKNYITDDKYAVCGTINVDYRSLYLHFENAILLINDKSIIEMKENFLKDISESKEVTYEQWNKRSIFTRLLQFVLKVFSSLI